MNCKNCQRGDECKDGCFFSVIFADEYANCLTIEQEKAEARVYGAAKERERVLRILRADKKPSKALLTIIDRIENANDE
jgi:hypothetical protein